MKNNLIRINVNKHGGVGLLESTKLLEQNDDETLQLVRRTYPYKLPTNYLSWKVLSAAIALGITGIESGLHLYKRDQASFLHSHKCALWFVKNHPIYCLKAELLYGMLLTDITDNAAVIKDLKPNIPGFIVLFPKNTILTSDNTFIDFAIAHISDVSKKHESFGSKHGINVDYLPHEHEVNIHWSGIDDQGTVWISGAGLKVDGSIEFSTIPIGLSPMKLADQVFLRTMRSLILQVYLLLQYKPEIIDDVSHYDTVPKVKAKGFSKSADKERVLYPRWLGKKERIKKPSLPLGNSTHASPATHWRRGHWRRAAVGQGRKDTRWVWVQPTLVNA